MSRATKMNNPTYNKVINIVIFSEGHEPHNLSLKKVIPTTKELIYRIKD